MFRLTLLVALSLFTTISFSQAKYTISGSVHDSKTGEELIGATISVKELVNTATGTNSYGFYSLTIPRGKYTLSVRYLGFFEYSQEINLDSSQVINVNLNSSAIEVKQIVVSARKADENVKEAQMSATKLDIKQLEKIPVIFGEKDILKTIQLLPGVKSAGEGNSGFYVRGGGSDQNLILLDEALVYNASHLLGFFSTFNNDALKDATLYKGNMPAEYGGKLSSVLDIKMKEGNNKTYGVGGGIGLIASRLYAEGPIVKDKGSFLVTGRRTYADLFLKLSSDTSLNKSVLYFYDINVKANYRFNTKNRVFLSGYFGRDKFGLGSAFGIDYGNATATARWNSIATDRLFSNLSFIYNNFSWKININNNGLNVDINSIIQDYSLKEDLEYFLDSKNSIKFGGQTTIRSTVPGEVTSNNIARIANFKLTPSYGWENALYAQHMVTLGRIVNLNYGLRLSSFTLAGPGSYYQFNGASTPDTSRLKFGQLGKTYINPEPRVSMSVNFVKNMSFKAAYSRNVQNIHLLTNSTVSNPTDRWLMTSNNVRPEIADQVSLGYFFNFKDNMFELSLEGYYKDLQNQIDYKPNAQLRANETVEGDLLYGKGRAYGGEVFLRKKAGKVTGWISYTLSRTERKFEGVNNAAWFPARYDRTHDLAVVLMWDITPRINVAATWVYSTGNAVTYPVGKYYVDGRWVQQYGLRNEDRFPTYHRLDIGITFVLKKRRLWEHDLNISVYNLYNRRNAYQINFEANANDGLISKATVTSLFGTVPSITYNFKFTYFKKEKKNK